jgi:aspartokinase-like uncharacterized kinase
MKNPVLFVSLFLLGFSLLTRADERAPDAVEVHPEVHHVLIDNEHIRVFRAMDTAGNSSPMHSHPPFVLVSLGQARLQMTLPNGEAAIVDLLPGQVMWLEDGLEHSWRILSGEAHVIAVEVKSAAK